MKAILIVALGTAMSIGGPAKAAAQSHAAQAGQPHRAGADLNGIELTDAQKTKQEAIQQKYQPRMMALREQIRNGGDRAEAIREGIELRDRYGADIRAILTPAQQTVFDKNVAEMKLQMQQMQRQTPPSY